MLESTKKEEIEENQEGNENENGMKRKLSNDEDDNISKRAKVDTTNITNPEANDTIVTENNTENNYLNLFELNSSSSGMSPYNCYNYLSYSCKLFTISHSQLIEKIEASTPFNKCSSDQRKIIRLFLDRNPEMNGSHLCEDSRVNLLLFQETINSSKTEYANVDIVFSSIVFSNSVKDILFSMMNKENKTTKQKEIESLKECKENKDLLEFDRKIIDSEFPKQSIYVRRCYVDLYNEIINQFDINDNLNILVLGNPGIGKSVFSYYLIYKLKEETEKNIKDIPITYILQTNKNDTKQECYEISNKQIKRINYPDVVENKSIVISDSYDVGSKYTNTSLIILISSPDVSQYKVYKKTKTVKEYYFDYWNDEEIKNWKNSCTKIEDDVFERCVKYYGNNPRNINLSSKKKEEEFEEYFNEGIISAIGQYSNNICKYGEDVNSKSTNVYSHKIFKYKLIYENNSMLCVKVEEGMCFISEAIECVFKNKLGLSLKKEEFDNIYELFKKENNPSVKGFFYEALVHFILRYYSFLINLPESKNYFNIFDHYDCPTFKEGEVFNNKNTYFNLNKISCFPDIDSYGGGWLFQMTISDQHNCSLFIEPLVFIIFLYLYHYILGRYSWL